MAVGAVSFVVSATQGGARLDRLVADAAEVSRRIARLWISAGRVQVNRRVMRILTRPIAAGAAINIDAEREDVPQPAQHAALEILYLDRWMVAVNKPPRLLSEHDRFGSPSLESVLPPLLEARGEQPRLWLVHRLDAGTSGVIVLARTPMAVRQLNEVFREGRAQKTYVALCQGTLSTRQRIDAPLGRSKGTRQCVTAAGKSARTDVAPLAMGNASCVVRAAPRTGRTHQIRVHLAHVGHPLLGDRLYGGPGFTAEQPPRSIGRPMLHAQALVLPHPKSGEPVSLAAPVPLDFRALAEAFGIEPGWE